MDIEEKLKSQLMPDHLDLLTDFEDWFREVYCSEWHDQKVVVVDKDETLISSAKDGKVAHYHLINEVIIPFSDYTLYTILVLFTVAGVKDLLKDYHAFPQLFSRFNLIITGDNISSEKMEAFCHQLKLSGDPLLLEEERMKKPVDKIFRSFPVVLLDDNVGTSWISVKEGVHGIRAYSLEQDNNENAQRIFHQIIRLLGNQPSKHYTKSSILQLSASQP